MEWSRALASRVLNDSGLSAEQQIERAYRIASVSRAELRGKQVHSRFPQRAVRLARRAAGEGRQGADARRPPARHDSGPGGGVCGPLPCAAELERVHLHELDGRNAIMIGNLQDSHYRRAATRRDFFTRVGSGLAGVALAQMLQEDALAAAASAVDPMAPEEAASSANGQVHHLALHGRRPEPCRPVRPQAQAAGTRGPAASRFDAAEVYRHAGHLEERADAVEANLQAAWTERPLGFGLVPEHRAARRRHDRRPILLDRRHQPPGRRHRDEQRLDSERPSLARRLGELRSGQRQPESAFVRRDAR